MRPSHECQWRNSEAEWCRHPPEGRAFARLMAWTTLLHTSILARAQGSWSSDLRASTASAQTPTSSAPVPCPERTHPGATRSARSVLSRETAARSQRGQSEPPPQRSQPVDAGTALQEAAPPPAPAPCWSPQCQDPQSKQVMPRPGVLEPDTVVSTRTPGAQLPAATRTDPQGRQESSPIILWGNRP